MSASESLDALVRRVDEDRWLASRFAPEDARVRLVALYALNHEIAVTAERVREPALGDIRLRWWRDQLAQAAPDHAHPALAAFVRACQGASVSPEALTPMIDARAKDLDAAPFGSWDDVEAYVEGTSTGVACVAARLAQPGLRLAGDQAAAVKAAGRAWGLTGLARAAPVWRARGRTLLPPRQSLEALLDRAKRAFQEAAAAARALPKAAFPALAHVTLAGAYLRALTRDPDASLRRSAPLARRLRLVRAVALGRL